MPTVDTVQIQLAKVRPPVPMGDILDVLWWNGSSWLSLLTAPIDVDIDFPLTLAVSWKNTGKRRSRGIVDLVITAPDGLTFRPPATTGQNSLVNVNGNATVQFQEFLLDLDGTYSGSVTLSLEIA